MQPTMVPTGSMQGTMSSGVRDSDSLSTFESDCTDGDRASKKQKVSRELESLGRRVCCFPALSRTLQFCCCSQVEWTDDLHDRFVIAVETLGADSAVPSKILEIMGPVAAGLTRQNIASHLQKFRYRCLWRLTSLQGCRKMTAVSF